MKGRPVFPSEGRRVAVDLGACETFRYTHVHRPFSYYLTIPIPTFVLNPHGPLNFTKPLCHRLRQHTLPDHQYLISKARLLLSALTPRHSFFPSSCREHSLP